jgi:hypothetical protein
MDKAELITKLRQCRAIIRQQQAEIDRLRPLVMNQELLEEHEDRVVTKMQELCDAVELRKKLNVALDAAEEIAIEYYKEYERCNPEVGMSPSERDMENKVREMIAKRVQNDASH